MPFAFPPRLLLNEQPAQVRGPWLPILVDMSAGIVRIEGVPHGLANFPIELGDRCVVAHGRYHGQRTLHLHTVL